MTASCRRDLEEADVVLVGVSRTSKTPTSIYLANRGIKTANVPIVPGIPLPAELEQLPQAAGRRPHRHRPSASCRSGENRVLSPQRRTTITAYIDRKAVSDEIAESRRQLCARKGWPVIDVTRRSIEETAAAILALLKDHRRALIVET